MKHYYHFLVFAGLLLTAFTAFGQGYQVSGRVTDSFTNESLAGVNVIVKGTSTGTITDIDGYYNVQVPDGSTALVFSFIGFVTWEQAVSSSASNIDVQLKEDVTNLEEVVITGLASSVKRSNLANAVSSISADELTGNTTQASLDKALYGKMTGVNMVSNGGAPGGGESPEGHTAPRNRYATQDNLQEAPGQETVVSEQVAMDRRRRGCSHRRRLRRLQTR